MAKVTIVEQPPVQPPPKVILELSMDEAKLLRILTGKVNGSGPVRELADSIWDELESAIPLSFNISHYANGLVTAVNYSYSRDQVFP